MCDVDTAVREYPAFRDVCVRKTHSRDCCRSWSLPNYVALLSNRSSCHNITQDDVSKVILNVGVWNVCDVLLSLLSIFDGSVLSSLAKYHHSRNLIRPWASRTVESIAANFPLQLIFNCIRFFQQCTDYKSINSISSQQYTIKNTLGLLPVLYKF